jgi:hypothetical protein
MTIIQYKPRTADEQCKDYIANERDRKKSANAARDVDTFMEAMRQKYGKNLAFGALVRYVGMVLIAMPDHQVTHVACRVLAKRIVESIYRRLTGRRIIH